MNEEEKEVKERIRRQALTVGFDVVGFAPATADPHQEEDLRIYLAEGRHGEMAWMADTETRRASPTGLWPDVRSIIVLGSTYAPASDPLGLLEHPECGGVSVYARNKDYHDLVKKRLKVLARWMVDQFGCELKVFVDTAPVMEKSLAAKAGIGWRGRHTNIVSRNFGSWLFLSEIFTTLELTPDSPLQNHCGRCRACLAACPTGAIKDSGKDSGGTIDPRRCISYLTIEHRGPIPEDLRPLMGNRIYGCDDCLAVCPWNKFAQPTREADFQPRLELMFPQLADLARLDDAGFREVFAGSPVKRIGRDRFVRNVLIAIGNSGIPALIEVARELLNDDDETIRVTAAWAEERLTK